MTTIEFWILLGWGFVNTLWTFALFINSFQIDRQRNIDAAKFVRDSDKLYVWEDQLIRRESELSHAEKRKSR